MLVSLARQEQMDCSLRNAIALTQLGLSSLFRRVRRPDFSDLSGGQVGVEANTVTQGAPFCISVMGIVQRRSEEQMIGPNTRRIVTVMENEQSVRNRPVGNLPSRSVCMAVPIGLSSLAEESVSTLIGGRSPDPAVITFLNLGPKAFGPRATDARLLSASAAAKGRAAALQLVNWSQELFLTAGADARDSLSAVPHSCILPHFHDDDGRTNADSSRTDSAVVTVSLRRVQ